MQTPLVEEAISLFKNGYSCSQAILMTFGQQYGLDEQTAKKLACSFGGGMGRTCQTCGAVTGAYLVIGLMVDEENNKLAKERTYALVQEFAQKFQEKHGDVNCERLLGCNLGTVEGQQYFINNHLVTKCKSFVKNAAIILQELSE